MSEHTTEHTTEHETENATLNTAEKPAKTISRKTDNIAIIRRMHSILLREAYLLIKNGLPLDNKLDHDHSKADEKKFDNNISINERDLIAKRRVTLNRHAMMWGKNETVVDILARIADTELKIEKQRPTVIEQENTDYAPALDEKDVELVKHYLKRNNHESKKNELV